MTGVGPEKTAGEYDNIYKKLQADLEENLKNHSEEDKAKARQHLLSILQDTEADLHNHPQGMEWISDPGHHLYAVKRVIDHLNDSTNYNVDYTRAIIHHSAKGLQNILNIPGKIYSYLKHLEVDPDDWKAYQQEVDVARKAAAQGDSSSLEALADRELKCRSDPNREIPWQTNLVAGLDKPETEPGKILGWFVELATEGAAIVFLLRAAKLLANLKGVGKGKAADKAELLEVKGKEPATVNPGKFAKVVLGEDGIPTAEQILASATIEGKNRLTHAGRALQKHSQRPEKSTVYPDIGQKAKDLNATGENMVRNILDAPDKEVILRSARENGKKLDLIEIRINSGQGIRCKAETGEFITFLEPESWRK